MAFGKYTPAHNYKGKSCRQQLKSFGYIEIYDLIALTTQERLLQTGLGARVMADMAGKRPLCARGPLMSA
jgi:hypothetical protein